MKSAITLFLWLMVLKQNSLKAQNVFPATINITGNSITNGIVSWDWSLGEPLMLNNQNTDKYISIYTGYLQNDFGVGVDLKLFELPGPFKIGSNPVIQNLKIISNQNGIVISKIEVLNEQGQLYKIIQGPFSGIQFEQSIPFASANTGIYFILIHYVVKNSFFKMKIFKVIKA